MLVFSPLSCLSKAYAKAFIDCAKFQCRPTNIADNMRYTDRGHTLRSDLLFFSRRFPPNDMLRLSTHTQSRLQVDKEQPTLKSFFMTPKMKPAAGAAAAGAGDLVPPPGPKGKGGRGGDKGSPKAAAKKVHARPFITRCILCFFFSRG